MHIRDRKSNNFMDKIDFIINSKFIGSQQTHRKKSYIKQISKNIEENIVLKIKKREEAIQLLPTDMQVCGKLLTNHRRGKGDDENPSVIVDPSGKVPESYGGGIRVLAPYLIVWGYVGIYRRKKYVGGALGDPRGRGARPPPSCPPVAPLTYSFHLYIPTYPQTIKDEAKTLIPPP